MMWWWDDITELWTKNTKAQVCWEFFTVAPSCSANLYHFNSIQHCKFSSLNSTWCKLNGFKSYKNLHQFSLDKCYENFQVYQLPLFFYFGTPCPSTSPQASNNRVFSAPLNATIGASVTDEAGDLMKRNLQWIRENYLPAKRTKNEPLVPLK